MQVTTHSLGFYVKRLVDGEPYSFVRYGNGEWDCIFKNRARTGSGSQALTPALRMALMKSLIKSPQDENFFLAMQSRTFLTRCGLLGPAEQWLKSNAPNAKWYCGEVFHTASIKQKLYPLVEQLRKMQVVVVGPTYLRALEGNTFKYAKFVPVQGRDCFTQYKSLYLSILNVSQGLKKPVVISFSAGPAAKVLIHDLYSQIGKDTFLIDFGSVWDPYSGKNTRRYHGRLTPAIKRRNLTGK